MHKTIHPDVVGFIDNYKNRIDTLFLNGWCFHKNYPNTEFRLKYELNDINKEIYLYNIQFSNSRKDVADYYKNPELANCGWKFHLKKESNSIKNIELQMNFDNKWNTIYTFDNYNENGNENGNEKGNEKGNENGNDKEEILIISSKQDNSKSKQDNSNSSKKNLCDIVIQPKKYIPSFVVVDNFYENVDNIRLVALKLQFINHPDYHKGKRTEQVFRFDGLKENFEQILGNKIKNWDSYGVNGCFQICVAGDQLVYHYDMQEYAGILFLSPDAPPETGTSFYRSKITLKRKIEQKDIPITFKTGFLDSTQFDLVDIVGNVYNRLVLFDAQQIHAASNYFGDKIENGRLFQLFFFDLER